MTKPPAFQFYATDFKIDTEAMSAEEVGVYIRLLCSAWVNDCIPVDRTQQARIAGVSRRKLDALWPTLERCWESDGNGGLVNPRMERVRSEQRAFSLARSEAGKAGAKARWS